MGNEHILIGQQYFPNTTTEPTGVQSNQSTTSYTPITVVPQSLELELLKVVRAKRKEKGL